MYTLETYLANARVIFFGILDFLPNGNTLMLSK